MARSSTYDPKLKGEQYAGYVLRFKADGTPDLPFGVQGVATLGPGYANMATGQSWKSLGPARVCRFYGSPAVNPATNKRMGPNDHFYTISADECAIVKEDAGWQFASYDFSGWPKQGDGSCAAGTTAVMRAYNNRFATNDSNHRYATSEAVYSQMLAQGWAGEGTVFCAPN